MRQTVYLLVRPSDSSPHTRSFVRFRFGVCTCQEHASLTDVSWSDTGFYNPILARAILNAAKACMKKGIPAYS